jgi:hypothetical protein
MPREFPAQWTKSTGAGNLGTGLSLIGPGVKEGGGSRAWMATKHIRHNKRCIDDMLYVGSLMGVFIYSSWVAWTICAVGHETRFYNKFKAYGRFAKLLYIHTHVTYIFATWSERLRLAYMYIPSI